MPRPLLIFTKSNCLIQVVDTNLHTEWHKKKKKKKCRSRSFGFWRNLLIWIYTVCKGRAYSGSVGPELECWFYFYLGGGGGVVKYLLYQKLILGTVISPGECQWLKYQLNKFEKEWTLRAMNTLSKLNTAQVLELLGQTYQFQQFRPHHAHSYKF